MSEDEYTATIIAPEGGRGADFRWEVDVEIIAPAGVNLDPLVQGFTALQARSLQGPTDSLRPTGAGAMCQRWDRALYWSEEEPDFGCAANGATIVGFEALVAVTLHCPDGRAVSLTGWGHERVVFGYGKARDYYKRLEQEDKGQLALYFDKPTGDPEHPYLDMWVWRPRGVQQRTRRTTTTAEAGGPARFRWEVDLEIIVPHGVNLDPLVQGFTALQARSLQGPTDLLQPQAEKSLAKRWEQALYLAGAWPHFGQYDDGRPIIAFEAEFDAVLRAPDGSEIYLGGEDEIDHIFGSYQWRNVYGPRSRGEGVDVEGRVGSVLHRRTNYPAGYLDMSVWEPRTFWGDGD